MAFFTGAGLAALFVLLFSCANVKSGEKTVTITGIVLLQGNEPHTMVIIEDKGPGKKRYLLEGKLVSKLKDKYQHRTVTVAGYITGRANPPLFPEKLRVVKILDH